MPKQDNHLEHLSNALNDHGADGLEILTTEPKRLIGLMIWLVFSLVMAAVVWSFFGKAPETVVAMGTVSPDSEVRRFYAPIEGELVDVFVSEGQPVIKGDVLARLNARGAIETAARALDAQIKLEEATRNFEHFPEKKILMQRKANALKRQIDVEERLHERRIEEGFTKLKQAQKAKMQEALARREKARRTLDIAREEMRKFERLLNGGGVSKNQVALKRTEYLSARADFRVADVKLGQLEFELSREDTQASVSLEEDYQKLVDHRIEYETLIDKIRNEESKVSLRLKSAKLEAEAASRVSFDNIDEENFLLIRAPESGVITELPFTQPGDKIQANTPLGGIAPEDASAVLRMEIAESDRGLLEVGLPVEMKFNAFPYQRYGFIEGVLEYLSPAARPSKTSKGPVFNGRVRLKKDYFELGEKVFPLRYGMIASAEIVVRHRRLIDLFLDPLRKVTR
ncbi:MAG TPA: HlyD family efflux transporter periplasmic adaptor subunit [Gammaproteobacteria bacterium]|nr:HlyD family efflux transporter periplasmic adaptor subunit [Gammaproteobacteria bacterium]